MAIGHVSARMTARKRKQYFTVGHTVFEVDLRYLPLKEVGKGAFGVVCAAVDTLAKEKVAIKKINNVFECLTDALRSLREMLLLRHIKHENVIVLKDVMLSDKKESFKDVYLVYELMDTDLHRVIKSRQPLSNDHIKFFMFQLLSGLEYLHSLNILHRDLKPGNLLVNANCELKICDFGLARTTNVRGELMTEYVVTRWYRAPELLLWCDNYGGSIDVWSVGCILAELIGHEPLFPGKESLHQLHLIIQVLGTPSDENLKFIDNERSRDFIRSLPYSEGTNFGCLYPGADPLAIDLLQRLLVLDPSRRITVKEALQHPYLSDLYDPMLTPAVAPLPLEINIDENSGEHRLRELMWDEMLHYNPEAAFIS